MALYSERGYEETTVAEIAERAGLTKRTFFRYFTDKREVLFWGWELLERQMVAAIEAAPASASALDLVGAALDAAAAWYEEAREVARPWHRIIASSHELQERALIKSESLGAAMAGALRARGFDDTAAALTVGMGTIVMRVAFQQWIDDPDQTPFQRIVRAALAQFREIASAG